MAPVEQLRKVDRGLGAAAEFLMRLAPQMMQKNFARFVELVAGRIDTLQRERDNLYALSASKFDRSELDQVLKASRKKL